MSDSDFVANAIRCLESVIGAVCDYQLADRSPSRSPLEVTGRYRYLSSQLADLRRFASERLGELASRLLGVEPHVWGASFLRELTPKPSQLATILDRLQGYWHPELVRLAGLIANAEADGELHDKPAKGAPQRVAKDQAEIAVREWL